MSERAASGRQGLYRREFEHDNCGIGAVVNSKGIKSHQTVENALRIVENLEQPRRKRRGRKNGDGVGILLQISTAFSRKPVKRLIFPLEMRENTVSPSCFCPG